MERGIPVTRSTRATLEAVIKWCVPCKEQGVATIANKVVNEVPKCTACLRRDGKDPAPLPPAEPTLAREAEASVAIDDEGEGSTKVEVAEPRPEKVEETLMSRGTRKQIDWAAAQADRDSGQYTLAELAKKYGCSNATIVNHTKKPATDPRTVRAGAGSKGAEHPARQAKPVVRRVAKVKATSLPSDLENWRKESLLTLTGRRDELQRELAQVETAIAALDNL